MPTKLLSETADAYFQYGVLGITVVVLLIVAGSLIWYILKDKKHEEKSGIALAQMATNQEKSTLIYQESQKQHKEVVGLLNETLNIERANTKECYINVDNKLDTLINKQKLIEHIVKSN